jgi:hypothetical protein
MVWEVSMQDLFSTSEPAQNTEINWILSVFYGNGAIEAIRKAIEYQLQIYYPHKINKNNQIIPIWRSYLFLEFIPKISVEVCRFSSKFVKVITDKDGSPILIRQSMLNESLELLKSGWYNDISPQRKYYNGGATVRINSQDFWNGKFVRLLCDIQPSWSDDKMVPIEINGWKCLIELRKLALEYRRP